MHLNNIFKKLFGGLNITWKRLITFAVICGIYTGVMAMLPFTANTSFRDISIHFEWWILFAIIIITNAKTALDSALKTFVFFLISQPLVYLVQVPFNDMGFLLFKSYPHWFMLTVLTFPAAMLGYFMRKNNWWGLIILLPVLLFLGYHLENYFGEAIHFFPTHLLSAMFCVLSLIIYPLFVFKKKALRKTGLIISVIIIIASIIFSFIFSSSHVYETDVLLSGDSSGVVFDESATVYLENKSYGDVEIVYKQATEEYMVHAKFKKLGKTKLVLVLPGEEEYYYDLEIDRNNYKITPSKTEN